jgi:metal-responsive CopG/Arc/MetJ family transcriptional regulator
LLALRAALSSTRKTRAGISFDSGLVEALDGHAQKLTELHVDRSEIVNAILDDFFDGNGTTESVWNAVSKRRVKRRPGR